MHWSLTTAIVFVIVYSLVFIAFDEFVAKPWRRRRWEQRAAAGDAEAQEILTRARAGHAGEEE